ncbi:unnamed protein product [Arctogadus glacialis]
MQSSHVNPDEIAVTVASLRECKHTPEHCSGSLNLAGAPWSPHRPPVAPTLGPGIALLQDAGQRQWRAYSVARLCAVDHACVV